MHHVPKPRCAAHHLAPFALLAVLALGPAPARGQPGQEHTAAWRTGAGLGVAVGMGDDDYAALAVRVDAERSLRALSPRARLGFVVSAGMSHPSGSESVAIDYDPFTGTFQRAEVTWDANVFDFVPTARFVFAASPAVSLYADGGLGLSYTIARASVPASAAALGISGGPAEGIAAVLRLGGGLVFRASPALDIALEVVGVQARFGDGVGTSFQLLAAISHQL